MSAIIELVYERQEFNDNREDDMIIIEAIATCGIAGSQKPHAVARVSQINNPNPIIEWFDELTTLGMCEKVIKYIHERPWN